MSGVELEGESDSAVENQELHLATSLTRTLREKVSRCFEAALHTFMGRFGKEIILKLWCMTPDVNTD